VLDICSQFQAAGLRVVLSHQGVLGGVALALGLVDGFTVGIGMGESVNHPAVVARQCKPREEGVTSWPAAGIYVPGIKITLPRRTAEPLYEDTAIRSRLACRIGHFGSDIRGPLVDARSHYLHARASEVAILEGQPQAWRPNGERTRVERAVELRQLINAHHMPAGAADLKTRTLRATLGYLGGGHGRMRHAG
jgi:hypothetical protein